MPWEKGFPRPLPSRGGASSAGGKRVGENVPENGKPVKWRASPEAAFRPPAGRKRKTERRLWTLPPLPDAYFWISALNRNSREAERYLSSMASATGSRPCIPCGISGVTAATA